MKITKDLGPYTGLRTEEAYSENRPKRPDPDGICIEKFIDKFFDKFFDDGCVFESVSVGTSDIDGAIAILTCNHLIHCREKPDSKGNVIFVNISKTKGKPPPC